MRISSFTAVILRVRPLPPTPSPSPMARHETRYPTRFPEDFSCTDVFGTWNRERASSESYFPRSESFWPGDRVCGFEIRNRDTTSLRFSLYLQSNFVYENWSNFLFSNFCCRKLEYIAEDRSRKISKFYFMMTSFRLQTGASLKSCQYLSTNKEKWQCIFFFFSKPLN